MFVSLSPVENLYLPPDCAAGTMTCRPCWRGAGPGEEVTRQRKKIEAYLGRLFGYAFSLTRSREDSQDLVQDCVLRALSARSVPGDEPAYRAWLFRILRNLWYDQIKRPKLVELGLPADDQLTDTDVWSGDERRINALTVRLALSRLSLQQREVIALVDIVGLSYAEAARVLALPTGTVMSRLSRARRALLAILAEDPTRAPLVRAGRSAR